MSELLRLRDQVKKAEIRYLEKVSKTGNVAVNLRRSWGNSRLIFWPVSELGGAIDVSKCAGHDAEKSERVLNY